jgi:hypothetical protein
MGINQGIDVSVLWNWPFTQVVIMRLRMVNTKEGVTRRWG